MLVNKIQSRYTKKLFDKLTLFKKLKICHANERRHIFVFKVVLYLIFLNFFFYYIKHNSFYIAYVAKLTTKFFKQMFYLYFIILYVKNINTSEITGLRK